MTRPSLPPARTIGFWTAVALVMGNMIGSGIFLLPASLATFRGIGLLGWLVSAGGSVCLALVFARLSRLEPAAGGPYAYTRAGFGDLAGFLVAWGYWISCWCGNAAIAIAFVGYLEPFLHHWFGAGVETPVITALIAIASVWLLTGVNVWGIRTAGQVQVVTTVLKILPLLLVCAAAFVRFDATPFAIVETSAREFSAHLAAAATLTFWAFGGLESATIPATSVIDPVRTIPRATVVGTLLAAGIYIISTIGVMSIVPIEQLSISTAPFADAARAFAGNAAAAVVAAGAAIACFGALNGWILIAGQVPAAIAGDGLFPRGFARLSSRGTPARALIISSALTTALIALNYSRGLVDLFTFILLLGTLSALVPYTFSSLAGFLIDRGGTRAPLTVGGGIVAGLAFIYSIWAIGGAGADVVYWGFLLLLAGLPMYIWVKRAAEGVVPVFHRNQENGVRGPEGERPRDL